MGVGGAGVVQVGGTWLPVFLAPDWVQHRFVVLVALGFPVALILGWFFEISGGGLRKTVIAGTTRSADYRRLLALGATGLFIAGAALAGYLAWHPWRNFPDVPAASSIKLPGTDTAATVPDTSVAVLPFEPPSDDNGTTPLADVVHAEILTTPPKI